MLVMRKEFGEHILGEYGDNSMGITLDSPPQVIVDASGATYIIDPKNFGMIQQDIDAIVSRLKFPIKSTPLSQGVSSTPGFNVIQYISNPGVAATTITVASPTNIPASIISPLVPPSTQTTLGPINIASPTNAPGNLIAIQPVQVTSYGKYMIFGILGAAAIITFIILKKKGKLPKF